MKIPKEEFAKRLDGREYRSEMTESEKKIAKENNLVVVTGASDGLMQFDGAIYDETGSWDGGKCVVVPVGGKFSETSEDDEEVIITRQPLMRPVVYEVNDDTDVKDNVIEAIWCPEDEKGDITASWAYKTEIPHAVFKIVEDDEVYCFGIVFSMDDVKR